MDHVHKNKLPCTLLKERMSSLNDSVSVDVDKVGRISIIPAILEMVCRVTGMGFSAVARVTPEKWVACGVHDNIQFGLMAGGELKVDTTICHEIRQSGEGVIIDHVEKDEFYCTHHTPLMYGFQSYISIPIKRQDGRFFGTLCAIDPSPAILNTPEIIGMFKNYASLISFHLNAAEQLPSSQVLQLEEMSAAVISNELTSIFGQDTATPLPSRRSPQFAAIIRSSSLNISVLISHLQASIMTPQD